MREIKFRVWDKGTKEMVAEGFHVIGEVTCFGMIDSHIDKNMCGKTSSLERWNDFELMQFTGLKDKNGKDIYEGDIVRSAYGVFYDTKTYPSFFNNTPQVETFTVEFKDGSYNKQLLPPNDNNFGYDVEVIGNIYENPNLLTNG